MEIKKILNNSTLLVEKDQKEFIVLGKGIGFNKKIGDKVDENNIEKRFATYNLPFKYYDISKDIIQTAENEFNCKFDDIIYLSLTDHIYNAIDRVKNNIELKNSLLNEIKIIYKKEFNHSLEALKYIYNETGYKLPISEAGFITMHFINASYEKEKEYLMITTVNEMLTIIDKYVEIDKQKETEYFRLVTHLKYFVISKIDKLNAEDNSDDIYELIKFKYPYLIDINEELDRYIFDKFKINIRKSESVLILLCIKSVVKNRRNYEK